MYTRTCKAVIFSVVCLSSEGLKDIWILSAAALGCLTAFFLRLGFPTVYGAIDGYNSEEWEAVQLLTHTWTVPAFPIAFFTALLVAMAVLLRPLFWCTHRTGYD